MRYYLAMLRKYAVFTGRATRREFWFAFLWNTIFVVGLLAVALCYVAAYAATSQEVKDAVATGIDPADALMRLFVAVSTILIALYSLVTLAPSTALLVRRLHDTGRSGWWYFLGLVPFVGAPIVLVLCCLDGHAEENKYGANPRAYQTT